MQSPKEFVDEVKEWANKFATKPDDIDELFYNQIRKMIEERDEDIRKGFRNNELVPNPMEFLDLIKDGM